MKAEEVYNIARHLSVIEKEKLICLLQKTSNIQQKKSLRPVRKKLIYYNEARKFILKTVFKIKPESIAQ